MAGRGGAACCLDTRMVARVRSGLVATIKGVAPIFPVHDLSASLAFYSSIGFTTRAYEGGGYGYATRDGIEIHLGMSSTNSTPAAAYLFVEDADEFAEMWHSAGAVVRAPVDTEWGKHEGVLVDPDGNVIRFGSAMRPTSK